MEEGLIWPTKVPEIEHQEEESRTMAGPMGDSVFHSRSKAVNAVIRGGATAGLGFGTILAANYGLFGSATVLVGLGAAVVAGAGLIWVGQAAHHLLRFGTKGSAVGLFSAGALGALAATWPLLFVLNGTGLWIVPMWLRQLFGMSFLGLSMIVLFFVLRVVADWAITEWRESSEEPGIV